jgi:protocatechuate 3,4-dioxygenase beta subunit
MPEKSELNINRRNLLGKLMVAAPISILGVNKVLAQSCGLTPEQTEGPFYPIADQIDKDNDLTFVKDARKKALGESCIIKGIVQNERCEPVEGALVEIWQACVTGKYNHPGDPNPAALDPNFQYWGRATTNKKGEYFFKTIVPGAYQATSTWMRPPHIHFKVHLRGFQELTTQMYWGGNALNQNDRILQNMSKAEQEQVVVHFKDQGGIKTGRFNLTLQGA